MALTVTNTNTLKLLNILNMTQARQSRILTQLSTGKRINTGADDPAGLIALVNFNRELVATNAAIDSNLRTDSQLAVADAALEEVSNLLNEIQALVSASANTGAISNSEIAANQAQIDSAIASIDRIIQTTTFNGKRLLDGSLAIHTTGVDNTKVSDLKVFSRPEATSSIQVVATITTSAQAASAAVGLFDAAGTAVTTSGTTSVSITGTLGNAVIEIGSGQNRDQIISTINAATAQTGVSASIDGNNIELNTTGFGSDEFITVDVLSGGTLSDTTGAIATNTFLETSNTKGIDAKVTINGQNATVDGLDVYFTANGLSLQYSLDEDYGIGNVANRSNTETFTVELSGGATFQLGTETRTRSTIGISALISSKLGGGDAGAFLSDIRGGQKADLNTDAATAIKTIKKAIDDVATARGRIGGFQKFQVQPSIRQLEAAKFGLTSAASVLGDTDFAEATAALNRENVLINAGIALLGVSNQQAAQILALLG